METFPGYAHSWLWYFLKLESKGFPCLCFFTWEQPACLRYRDSLNPRCPLVAGSCKTLAFTVEPLAGELRTPGGYSCASQYSSSLGTRPFVSGFTVFLKREMKRHAASLLELSRNRCYVNTKCTHYCCVGNVLPSILFYNSLGMFSSITALLWLHDRWHR